MHTYRPRHGDPNEAKALADRIDPERWIALRPIRVVGRIAFYWSLGKKSGTPHVWFDRLVSLPRVRWLPIIHTNQGEPR